MFPSSVYVHMFLVSKYRLKKNASPSYEAYDIDQTPD